MVMEIPKKSLNIFGPLFHMFKFAVRFQEGKEERGEELEIIFFAIFTWKSFLSLFYIGNVGYDFARSFSPSFNAADAILINVYYI